jgi:hypothetical protein
MLVTMNPGEPATCSEHGVLSSPAESQALTRGLLVALGVRFSGDVPDRLAAGVTALAHLRDVHGKDVDGALRRVLEEVKREAKLNAAGR